MAQFNNLSITNKGKILYAKAQTGIELKFTKMQVGSGLIGTQNPETLLALVDAKYDVGIQSITPNTEAKTATISGMINNSQVSDGVYICEIGLFAQDPEDGEILYAYGTAGDKGDWYASSTSGAYSWNYQIIAAVGNAANVTVELSNLVYDYGVISTNTTLSYLTGGNQKEINKSIDNLFRTYPTSNNGNIYNITASNITASSLKDGYPLCLKINVDSTGATSIKINSLTAILLKKANGQAITNLKANGIYTFRYNATTGNFILQGEGGGGTATPDKILAPYTATTDVGDITGTIPSKTAQTYTPSTTAQVITAGQYIAGPQTISPVTGNTTTADVILGKTFSSSNGINLVGTATIESLGGRPFKVATGGITWTTTSHDQFQREGITVGSGAGASTVWVITNTINLNFAPNFFIIKRGATSEEDLKTADISVQLLWHDGSVIPALNGAYSFRIGKGDLPDTESGDDYGRLVLLEANGIPTQFIHVNGSAVTWRNIEPSFTEHWYWKAMYI